MCTFVAAQSFPYPPPASTTTVRIQGVLMSMFVLVNELPVYRFLLLLTSPGRLLSGFQLQVCAYAPRPHGTISLLFVRGGGTCLSTDIAGMRVVFCSTKVSPILE